MLKTDAEPEVMVISPKAPVPLCVSRSPFMSTPTVPDNETAEPVVPLALVALMLKLAGTVVLSVS